MRRELGAAAVRLQLPVSRKAIRNGNTRRELGLTSIESKLTEARDGRTTNTANIGKRAPSEGKDPWGYLCGGCDIRCPRSQARRAGCYVTAMSTIAALPLNLAKSRAGIGGPQTEQGRAIASRNATKHGISAATVVISGESPEEWAQHRAGVLASLAPIGYLETEIATRIAELTWRLRRMGRYEQQVTTVRYDRATRLATRQLPYDEAYMKQYAERVTAAYALCGHFEWKQNVPVPMHVAKLFLRVIHEMGGKAQPSGTSAGGSSGEWTTDALLDVIVDLADGDGDKAAAWVREARDRLHAQLANLEKGLYLFEQPDLAQIPTAHTLQKLTKYEGHLERCLARTLTMFNQLKANRTEFVCPTQPASELPEPNVRFG